MSVTAEATAIRPFRIEASVAYDIGFNRDYALAGGKPLAALRGQAGRIEEGLGECSAIHMHFLVSPAVNRHLDHRWRKGSGNCR